MPYVSNFGSWSREHKLEWNNADEEYFGCFIFFNLDKATLKCICTIQFNGDLPVTETILHCAALASKILNLEHLSQFEEWLLDKYRENVYQTALIKTAAIEAAEKGHFIVHQWLIKKFPKGFYELTSEVFEHAVRRGDHMMIIWLMMEKCSGDLQKLFNIAAECGDLGAIELLDKHHFDDEFILNDEETEEIAKKFGHLHVVTWFRTDREERLKTCMVRWCIKEFTRCTEYSEFETVCRKFVSPDNVKDVIEQVVQKDYLQIFEWMQRRFEWMFDKEINDFLNGEETWRTAVAYGSIEIVNCVLKDAEKILVPVSDLYQVAAENGHLKVLQYLCDYFDFEDFDKINIKDVQSNGEDMTGDVVKWINKQRRRRNIKRLSKEIAELLLSV